MVVIRWKFWKIYSLITMKHLASAILAVAGTKVTWQCSPIIIFTACFSILILSTNHYQYLQSALFPSGFPVKFSAFLTRYKQKWVPEVFPGGKGGRCVRLTTLPPSCAVVMKSGNLDFLEPSGHLGPVRGLIYLNLYCTFCKRQSNPWTDPEDSRRLRLPDFKTISTWRW